MSVYRRLFLLEKYFRKIIFISFGFFLLIFLIYTADKIFSNEYRLDISTLPEKYVAQGITSEYIKNEISIRVKKINANEGSTNPTKFKSSEFKIQQTPPLRMEFRGNSIFLNETISAIRKLLGNEKMIEINIHENDTLGIRVNIRIQSNEKIYIAEDYYNSNSTLKNLETLILDQAVAIVARTNTIQLFSYVADNISFVYETNLLEIENNLSNSGWYNNLNLEDKLRVHMYYGQLLYQLNFRDKAYKHFKYGFQLASIENIEDSLAYQELIISYCQFLNYEGRAKETIILLSDLKVKYKQANFKYAVLGEAYNLVGEKKKAEDTWLKLKTSTNPISQNVYEYGMKSVINLYLTQNRFSDAEKLIHNNSLDKKILGLFSYDYPQETDKFLKKNFIERFNSFDLRNEEVEQYSIEDQLKFLIYKNEYPSSNEYLLEYFSPENNISIYQIRDYYNKYIYRNPDDFLTRYLFEEKLIKEIKKLEIQDSVLINHSIKLFDTLMVNLPNSPTVPLLGLGLIDENMDDKQVLVYLDNLKCSSNKTIQSIGNLLDLAYFFDFTDYDNTIEKLDSLYYEMPALDTITNSFIKNFRMEQFTEMVEDTSRTFEERQSILLKLITRSPDDYDLYIELGQLYNKRLKNGMNEESDLYPYEIYDFLRKKFPKKPDPILYMADRYMKKSKFQDAYYSYNHYINLKAKPIDSFYRHVYLKRDTLKYVNLEDYEENFIKSYIYSTLSDSTFYDTVNSSGLIFNLQKIANLYTQQEFDRKVGDIYLQIFFEIEDHPYSMKKYIFNRHPLHFLRVAVSKGYNLNSLPPNITEKYKDDLFFKNVVKKEYLQMKD